MEYSRSQLGSLLIGAALTFGLSGAATLGLTASEALGGPIEPPSVLTIPAVPASHIPAAIDALDTIVTGVLEETAIPGLAVAVVHGGETVFARGFGVRRAGDPAPVNADTVFLLASVSKPIGATVIATQVTAGTVQWDTPVREHLPWFRLADDWVSDHVTIGDLYAHRSGLPDHAGDDLEDLGFDRQTILERLHLLDLHPFRAHYAYTNFGLTAAAEAVAAAAGTDWATLSRTALYEPLGMTATSSRHDDFMRRPNRASSHVPGMNGFIAADMRQPDAQSPAGGVSASANDVAAWMAFVLGDGEVAGQRLVSPSALLPAVSPQVISSPPMSMDARAGSYGFGFNVGILPSGRVSLSHSGAFALGAATAVLMIPSLELGIVVLTNAPPVGAAEAVAMTFADRVQFGEPTRDWLAAFQPMMTALVGPTGSLAGVPAHFDPVPAKDSADYTGVFSNEYFGEATVEVRGDQLVLTLGPNPIPHTLHHWDADDFVVFPLTENTPAGSVSRVSFDLSGSGPASVTVEHLDQLGHGTFLRRD